MKSSGRLVRCAGRLGGYGIGLASGACLTESLVLGEADHSVELVAAGGDTAIEMTLVTGQRVDAGQLFAGYESLYPARRVGAMN